MNKHMERVSTRSPLSISIVVLILSSLACATTSQSRPTFEQMTQEPYDIVLPCSSARIVREVLFSMHVCHEAGMKKFNINNTIEPGDPAALREHITGQNIALQEMLSTADREVSRFSPESGIAIYTTTDLITVEIVANVLRYLTGWEVVHDDIIGAMRLQSGTWSFHWPDFDEIYIDLIDTRVLHIQLGSEEHRFVFLAQ